MYTPDFEKKIKHKSLLLFWDLRNKNNFEISIYSFSRGKVHPGQVTLLVFLP